MLLSVKASSSYRHKQKSYQEMKFYFNTAMLLLSSKRNNFISVEEAVSDRSNLNLHQIFVGGVRVFVQIL